MRLSSLLSALSDQTGPDVFFPVVAIYTKSGGGNGPHCYASESSTLSAVSNLVLRIFEPVYTNKRPSHRFRLVPTKTASRPLAIQRHSISNSTTFLVALSSTPAFDGNGYTLTHGDIELYNALVPRVEDIIEAVKELQGKGKKKDQKGKRKGKGKGEGEGAK